MTFLDSPLFLAFAVCLGAALATILGGLLVFRARPTNPRLLAFALAFAGGAMIYVSLVEILAKSQDSFKDILTTQPAYAAATLAFFAGLGLLTLLDRLLPNPHNRLDRSSPGKGKGSPRLHRIGLFTAIAITAHNIPEGMATFFATLDDPHLGLTLAVAIAVHNIPEGISVALPLYYATGSKRLALMATTLSALAEPFGAVLGYFILAPFLSPLIYGVLFGVIAGAMVYLALDELLPTARRYARGHETVHGLIAGMAAIAISLVLFK